ncbi:IS transposase [Streptomyces laurentii]|uniref:IS transposase n=1 Tax=Streptomyces laurentii TaxID=39478 RepID=A0A160P8Z3_STRLU|nr:IS transposase [Streptomyces laurentii]
MSQSFALGHAESNVVSRSCDCLVHRFGNAADRPDRVPCYASDMTEAEWQVVRASMPVPAWLEGWAAVRRAIATA